MGRGPSPEPAEGSWGAKVTALHSVPQSPMPPSQHRSASKGHRAQRLLWILPSSCAHPSEILVRLLAPLDSARGRTQRPNRLPACLLLRTILHFKLLRFKLLVIFLGCWEESVLIVRFDKVSSDQL